MNSSRIQGFDWAKLRRDSKLTILCVSKSTNGNYRVDVRCMEDGKVYHHWLNSREAKRLEESGFLATHELFSYDDLYKDGNALINRVYRAYKYVGKVVS